MRIWLINHYAVPPEYYPLARQTNFAKYLQQMGHEVIIFAASTVHNSNLNLIEDNSKYKKLSKNGIHYVLIKCRHYKGNGISRIYNMCEFAMKLPSVCKHFKKPDAIVATSMPPMSCAMGIWLAKKWKVKAIAEIADLWPESIVAYGIAKPNNPAIIVLRRLEKWIYTNADRIVFTMSGAYDYIEKQGWEKDIPKSKVFYINNGIDLTQFKYNKNHFQINDDDLNNKDIFKVIYTGSIRKVNNLGRLLNIAKQVKNKNVRFLIWGDGDDLELIRMRIINENINNIVLKGRVEKKFVPYIVSHADINIMHGDTNPIFKYGFSANKLFDYLAAEKPVLIDFFCKYSPVEDYNVGKILNGFTDNEIAKEIDEYALMDKEELLKYAVNARIAASHYDFEELTNELERVIKSI